MPVSKNLADFLRHADDERASQAVSRYSDFLDVAFKDKPADAAPWRLRFTKKNTAREIAAAEKRLGVRLSPSYVQFVTQVGIFSGPGEYAMYAPKFLKTLLDYLLEEFDVSGPAGLAEALELPDDAINRFKKSVCFANGQYEELVNVFEMIASDSITGEAGVWTFDRQDYMIALHEPAEEVSGSGFDNNVRGLLDFNIRKISKRLGQE